MSKQPKTPVVMSKKALLLPKMDFVVLDDATGEGLYVKELGGKALLEYKEKVLALKPDESDFSTLQSIELMADLVLRTACNANGTPYFTKEEVDLLADTSLTKLQALSLVAMEVSGIGNGQVSITELASNDS